MLEALEIKRNLDGGELKEIIFKALLKILLKVKTDESTNERLKLS